MLTHTTSSIGRTMVFAIAVGVSLVPTIAAHGQAPPEGAGDAAPPAGIRSPAAPVTKPDPGTCERYVAALAGREKVPAADVNLPEFRRLAARAADLVTCGAVRADSDDACTLLEKDAAEACRATRAMFHEMRAYPNGRSYMFDERKYQECKQSGGMPAIVCDTLRKALRAGDPSECVMDADFVALCRQAAKAGNLEHIKAADCATEGPAIRKMLEGHCRALVNLDASACDFPGPNAEGMAEQCRKDIEARQSFGKGPKELTKSGSPAERELAKATLDDPDACKGATKSALDVCKAGSSAPAAERAPGPKDDADVAAPGTAPPDAEEPPAQ